MSASRGRKPRRLRELTRCVLYPAEMQQRYACAVARGSGFRCEASGASEAGERLLVLFRRKQCTREVEVCGWVALGVAHNVPTCGESSLARRKGAAAMNGKRRLRW